MIKIGVLEDLIEVAESVKSYINEESDMECNHIYYNAEDAMTFAPHADLDLLIVDIGLPRTSGIEAMNILSDSCPKLKFCMFTVHEDDEKIFQSLQAGAKGYILKGASQEKIIASIRELHQGGAPMSPSIAHRIIELVKDLEVTPVLNSLPISSREMQLLTLLSKGRMYKEIADELGIKLGTVKQHIHNIYDKLQVSNKVEAINKLKNR